MLGKIVCELIPTKDNARNSEGAFLELKDGRIIYAYSRYEAGCHDHDPSNIYGVFSSDGGETFGEPILIKSAESAGAHNLMSVSLIRMSNGDVGLFYLQKENVNIDGGSKYIARGNANVTAENYAKVICMPYLIRSSDEGKTWSSPICCIKEKGYYTVNNDRIIILRSGRILMPVAKLRFDAPYGTAGTIMLVASDDDGFSWHTAAKDIELPVNLWHETKSFNKCPMEPGIVQLDDGTVWCFIRTKLDRQYEMLSTDDGNTWSVPNPSRFSSSNSPMSAKKLSDGKIFVLWNPIQRFFDRQYKGEYIKTKWSRTPMAYALLENDCGEFISAGDLEDDRERGFCYAAIHETASGDLLLGYCAGDVPNDGDWLNRIRIRKIYRHELDALKS